MTKYTTIAGDMWDGIAYKTLGVLRFAGRIDIVKDSPSLRRCKHGSPAGVCDKFRPGFTRNDIIDGLTQILSGLITFITGVFTGNWKQAWAPLL